MPLPLALEDGDVHVWRSSVDVSAPVPDAYWDLLSLEERARAGRYRFDRDRRRSAAARAVLRSLLGCYTGQPPASIVLRADGLGKPVMEPASALEFTVSHSHEMIVYVLARQRVGVDIEHVRPMPDALDIARRFFSADEIDALRGADERRLRDCFFACWTRKEAYLKALGKGLSSPLSSFSVSIDPERPAFLGDVGDLHRWTLANLDVPVGYVASLAVEGAVRSLVQRNWPE